MKKMRILFLALTMVLALTLGSTATAAPTQAAMVIEVEGTEADQGDDILIYVRMTTNPGIVGFQVNITCDTSVLVPRVDELTEELEVVPFEELDELCLDTHANPNDLRIIWRDLDNPYSGESPDSLFYMYLDVADNAPPGTYTLAFDCEVTDEKGNAAVLAVTGGEQTVTIPPHKGDVNGDGVKDAQDMACLFTYLSTGNNAGRLADSDYFAIANMDGDDALTILDYQALYMTLIS